jgi:hypothetical protein
VSNILKESELYEIAVDTLEQGMAIFPNSKRLEDGYREATQTALQFIRENQEEEIIEVLEQGPNDYLDQLDLWLAEGKYDETADLLLEIDRIGAPWLNARREDFEYRKLQLYFETRDSQLQIQSTSLFLNNNPDSGPELVQLARSYLNEGRNQQSRILVEEIVKNDPRNKEARQLLDQLGGPEIESKGMEATSRAASGPNVRSKTKVMKDLQALIVAKDWAATETLIQQILRISPPWLSRDRQEFDMVHIRYYLESGKLPSASSLIRIYMGSDIQSARQLLNLANEYDSRGLDGEKEFLVAQVQRKFPKMKL